VKPLLWFWILWLQFILIDANFCALLLSGLKFLGSVVASVVGLRHLFRTVADSNSARLKALASFLGKSCKNVYGKLEIVLRRNPIVSVDENAVCVLVPNPDQTFQGGKY